MVSMLELTIRTNDLVTFAEAARILGIARPSVYYWVVKYQLHPILIGHNRYLLRREVEALKSEQT